MRLLAVPFIVVSSLAAASVPPPPISPDAAATATGLARALEANDVAAYERLLAPNLEVWIEGRKVYASRAAWLKDFRPKLSANGVRYKVDKIVSGNSNFIILTHFDSRGSFEIGHQECCQFYEASKYVFHDGKISEIRIFSTGNIELRL